MKTCTYCGSNRKIVDDHIRAKIKGGISTTNACHVCNSSKKDKSLSEWFRWLKKNDKYSLNKIVDYHSGKRSDISQKVHNVRDE
jgi:5-methylcytosine-specific restriction endonuclease McrA